MYKYLVFVILLLTACKSQNVIPVSDPSEDEVYIPSDDDYIEERTLEELEIVAPRGYSLPRYNPARTRVFDLLHTDLDVRFDWVNQHVLGRATIQVKPYFYEQQYLVLDAKGMEIQSVTDAEYRPLSFEYDDRRIDIDLGRAYTRDEEVTVVVDYIAKPNEGPEGGSAAISSDKGLFFINPLGNEGDKPTQIWTQGETENNSRWFPTIDSPNENMTQTLALTVDSKYKTLSNGVLDRSVENSDGSRTDHYIMNDPHAPYLVMIAVGEFAVVKDKWRDIELEYYVEPEYEPYAKQIFAHTPEMLEFFSSILDYPYPWDKYSQIIVRDYVSGAMENTTAVIYGDFIQKTDRELIDNDNDYIVAHEMFHHWFGDLVTCESWANLTLQEGFANYSEYLWKEYKYGPDEADYHRHNENNGYLGSIFQSGIHPLIHYGHMDKEDMFDGHSYNKGGLVLHMLRHTIGDDAFFAGLNKYLEDNKYTAVEVDELRMAFEDVSGLDLHWFFDQWYLEAGHPELSISYDYNDVSDEIVINVDQTQDPEGSIPIFQMPVTVSAYDENGNESIFQIVLTEREQEIRIPHPNRPAVMIFDRDDRLLFVKSEDKSDDQYAKQYQWADAYAHRLEAISQISSKEMYQDIVEEALEDNHFSIRVIAVNGLRLTDRPELVSKLQNIATDDPHSKVRGAALKRLRDIDDFDLKPLLDQVFANELSYDVIADALDILQSLDNEAALAEATKLKDVNSNAMITTISRLLAASGDPTHLSYFENRLTSINLYSVFNFYDSYYELLSSQPIAVQLEKAQVLKNIATSPDQNIFYKYTSANTINKLKEDSKGSNADVSAQLTQMINDIKAQETNEMLLQRYSTF